MKRVLEEFTGILGIGYVFALGIFLLVDSHYQIYDNINLLSEDSSWGILASIPILMVAYIFGLIIIQSSELIIPKLLFPSIQEKFNSLLPRIMTENSELLNNRYMEVFQNKRILNGGFIAFITVGIGAYLDGHAYGESTTIFGTVGLLGGLALALICPLIGISIQKRFMDESGLSKNNIK